MWMVESNLKVLKVFVGQRSCSEGYMVYQTLVYVSECLLKVVEDINVPCIWDVYYINKYEGEVLLGKDRKRKVKHDQIKESYISLY